MDKRKREDDEDEEVNRRRGKEPDGVLNAVNEPPPPAHTVPCDDEVDEFFATLKRARVAVKYFRDRRNGVDGRELMLTVRRSLSSEVKGDCEHGADRVLLRKEIKDKLSVDKDRLGLDLNSDPVISDDLASSV